MNTVTLLVTDIYGNVDSCITTVTVLDTVAPNVICNGITVYLTQTGQFVLEAGGGGPSVATTMDNCGIDTVFVTRDTITCADVGNVIFTVTAIDVSGNTSTCQDTAKVFLEHPVIVAPALDTILFCPGNNLSLRAVVPPNGLNYSSKWTGPNGRLTFNPLSTDTTLNYLPQQSEGYYIFTITPLPEGCSASDSIYLKLDTGCLPSYISGNVFEDLNFNCSKDLGELNLSNILIEAKGDSTYYGTTDSAGNYEMIVPDDIYDVRPILPSIYWELCGTVQTVNSLSNPIINWGLQKITDCPLLEVDIAAPFLRKTNHGSSYVVSYCNKGTTTALNASIVVEVDPFLNILNSSLPIINQTGNICRFTLDSVPVNTCGSFTIEVVVNSGAINGQTHCSEVHAYPDSICIPDYWDGAILEPSALCIGDSVLFKLKNTGAGTYLAKSYTIFEDHIIMMTGNTRDIDSGDSISINVWADSGHTYRIVVAQETGFPTLLGDSIATAAIEGCRPYIDGSFNIGHITAFSNGNSSPFIAVDCQQNIASFDPNDKLAQPMGYQSAHYIYDHTILDYKIRFQNIGTDTAFFVILRDTLSPYLDPSTIVMGASSHLYTWRLYDQNILEIKYENILLPDSLVNEPASHGFIRYRIQQQPNNPIGTVIHNSADIHFDFNAPILTSQTWHTVGENFATINVDKIWDEQLNVLVYPNPFSYSTTFEVKGKEYQNLQLIVCDLTGRIVTEEQAHSTSKIHLSKGNMSSGVYFYQLVGNQKLINTGKIIVR